MQVWNEMAVESLGQQKAHEPEQMPRPAAAEIIKFDAGASYSLDSCGGVATFAAGDSTENKK